MAASKPRGVAGPSQEDFDRCRRHNHAWDEVDDAEHQEPDAGTTFEHLRCLRCTTWRHDMIDDRTGDLVKRNYDYADGYQYDSIDARPTRSDLRLAHITLLRDRLRSVQDQSGQVLPIQGRSRKKQAS